MKGLRAATAGLVALALVALGIFAAVPAPAKHNGAGHGSDAAQQRSDTGNQNQANNQNEAGNQNQADNQNHPNNHSHAGKKNQITSDATVNFRRNAIFSCFGAADGTATTNTANITTTFFTVTAVVTVHAPPGTTVFGNLVQSGCVRQKFFSFTVPASGVGVHTVSDLRISNDAFVYFSDTAGDFQITPEVVF